MPFSSLKLHPSLLRGIKELGFTRPTPIQADAIPPALEGRDVLACAMTGSGKTAAFLLPILHQLIDKPRGTTRALVLTPTRELAAQILEDLNDLAVHTPITGAAVFGGVGMGPQEHAFRSGVDVIVATPGPAARPLPRSPTPSSPGIEYLVLDEADRMLDMGFLPDIRRVLRHLPAQRQTLFFSATMPRADRGAHARDAAAIRRRSTWSGKPAPAVGHHPGGLPGAAGAQGGALRWRCCKRNEMQEALVFTRTKHRANRLAGVPRQARDQGRADPRQPLAGAAHRRARGFKDGRYRVLVATDIAARGIDVEELGHVVNFDVPHRAGGLHPPGGPHRARRADRRRVHVRVAGGGGASCAAIERAIGKRLPRVTCPTSTTRRGRRRGSRCRSPSGSRRSGPRRRRTGSAPRPRRRGARRTDRRPRRGRRRGRIGRAAERRAGRGPGRGGPGSGGRSGGGRPGGNGGAGGGGPRPAGGAEFEGGASEFVALSNEKGACLEGMPFLRAQ